MKKIIFILFLLCNNCVINCYAQFNLQRSWGTYFGDERFELAHSKIDRSGNLYIVGSVYGAILTNLTTFTNTTSHQQNFGGGDYDGFIIKFNPQGNIVWGTFFGGLSNDQISSIDIDNNDNIYIIGSTLSNTNIATVGSFQENLNGEGDFFISKFTSNGSIVWCTYFGGSGTEYSPNSGKISFDGLNNIYISSNIFSLNMATSGVFQENIESSSNQISKFDINGNRIWTTYYGERPIEDIKANTNGVYVSGATLDCPPSGSYNTYYGTANSFKPLPENCRELFLTKFNTNGQREWSTYYGGNRSEGTLKNGIDLKDDKVYWSGTSPNYNNQEVASINTYQPNSINASNFIAQFNQDGTRNWGTYNGNFGEGTSSGFPSSSIEIDENSNSFYNYGSTVMTLNVSTPDGYLTTLNNQFSTHAYICKFTDQNTKSWGTYYGGEFEERNIQFHPYDNGNKFYILGTTQSDTQISTPNSLQPTKQVFDLVNNTYLSAFTIFIAHFEPLPLSNSNFDSNTFLLYPNPSTNAFVVQCATTAYEKTTLTLFDMLGKKIHQQPLTSNQTTITTANFAKGIYVVKITSDENRVVIKKLVIE